MTLNEIEPGANRKFFLPDLTCLKGYPVAERTVGWTLYKGVDFLTTVVFYL